MLTTLIFIKYGMQCYVVLKVAASVSGGANLNPADMLACLQREKQERLLLQEQEQIAKAMELAHAEEEAGIILGKKN